MEESELLLERARGRPRSHRPWFTRSSHVLHAHRPAVPVCSSAAHPLVVLVLASATCSLSFASFLVVSLSRCLVVSSSRCLVFRRLISTFLRLPPYCTLHTHPRSSRSNTMSRQFATMKARLAAIGCDAWIVYKWARDLAFDQEMHLPSPFQHVLLQDRYPFPKLNTLSDDEWADAISCYRIYMYQYQHGFTERSTPRGAKGSDAATTTAGGCACSHKQKKHKNTQKHDPSRRMSCVRWRV